jgi:hypothetical protein
VLEPVADPLAALTRPRSLSARQLFHAMAGADVWNTVNALAAFRLNGRDARRMEAFLLPRARNGEGLCYWSARVGLCCETTAAMARLAAPSLRRRLTALLRRKAFPAGRWPSYIVAGPGGYEAYQAAPSVTAWILPLLRRGDARRRAGLRYLEECLDGRPIWGIHPAFYLTPFYPAHLAARLLPKASVLDYALSTQDESGGWAFGDPPKGPCAALPTALAILTLRAFPRSSAIGQAIDRGTKWLLDVQKRSGAFPRGRAPEELYYLGEVYTTCLSLFALTSASPREAGRGSRAELGGEGTAGRAGRRGAPLTRLATRDNPTSASPREAGRGSRAELGGEGTAGRRGGEGRPSPASLRETTPLLPRPAKRPLRGAR